MSEPTPVPTPATPAAAVPPAAPIPDPEAPLGEGGIKALQAERDARAAAESAAAALQKQLDEIAAEKLTDIEKAQKIAEEAVSSDTTTKAENLRLRFAIDNDVPAAWVDRLKGNTPEELAADWATLQPTLGAATSQPGKGTHVPGAGHQPPEPPSLSAQIAAAQAEGDSAKAMALKSQQLAELSRK